MFGIVLIVGVVLWIGFVWLNGGGKGSERQPITREFALEPLTSEVEKILDNKIFLVRDLIRHPTIIAEVKRANDDHQALSLQEILELDTRWRNAEGVDDFIKPFITNEVAFLLIQFQEDHIGFSEVFVTDVYGLNVGQTNKTTDYYQADEDWWIGAYNSGMGKAYHGPIEFDESAQAEAISLYIPIMDPETSTVIGVVKAVVSIAAIKMEL